MRAHFGRLTPSQESVFRFVSQSSRWLTAFEISKLTGVSLDRTKEALKKLIDGEFVEVRKRIYGWENGEREFHCKSCGMIAGGCAASRERYQTDRITGVVPLAARLRKILSAAKADQYAEFIE